ncbi:MAG: hypothetical protein ACE5E5_15710, partial [Phycisphaerae bacterium]
ECAKRASNGSQVYLPKSSVKHEAFFPGLAEFHIIFMDGLFGMDTSDFGGALKATLAGSSENFVRLFPRLGGGRAVGQHGRAACDPVAGHASSQDGVAQVWVLMAHRSGARVYYTAKFNAADAESRVQVHVTIAREAKQ